MGVPTVEQIMSSPVQSISMDLSLKEIQTIFEGAGHHHLVVTGEGKECVGVISDRDVLRHVSPFVGKMAERSSDIATLNRRAHQIMSRQLVAVRPNTLMRDAARVMLDHKISCLPVLDSEHHAIGIVTLRDVVRWAAESHGLDGGITKAAA